MLNPRGSYLCNLQSLEHAMDNRGRRVFLRNSAAMAALTLSSRMSAFGRTVKLKIFADVGAGASLPDRLPPEWYRRKIQQVQQEMEKRNLDALVLLHPLMEVGL